MHRKQGRSCPGARRRLLGGGAWHTAVSAALLPRPSTHSGPRDRTLRRARSREHGHVLAALCPALLEQHTSMTMAKGRSASSTSPAAAPASPGAASSASCGGRAAAGAKGSTASRGSAKRAGTRPCSSAMAAHSRANALRSRPESTSTARCAGATAAVSTATRRAVEPSLEMRGVPAETR